MPTISEIRSKTNRKLPFFFDKKTLKFFGQTVSGFKRHKDKNGNFYIYSKSYSTDHRTGKKVFMGWSVFHFLEDGQNSDLRPVFNLPKGITTEAQLKKALK